MRWESANTTDCEGTNFTASGVSGTNSIYEPTPGTVVNYIVGCTAGETTVADSLTVSTAVGGGGNLPTITLERSTDGGISWAPGKVTIDVGDQVQLRWQSTNADYCYGVGPNFDAYSLQGTDANIKEPPAGDFAPYTVTCFGSGNMVADILTINTRGKPLITAEPDLIKTLKQGGGESTIHWDTMGSPSCTLNGLSLPTGTVSIIGKQLVTDIETTEIFSITCPGGQSTVTVHTNPDYQER